MPPAAQATQIAQAFADVRVVCLFDVFPVLSRRVALPRVVADGGGGGGEGGNGNVARLTLNFPI